jgi:adenylate cyclase
LAEHKELGLKGWISGAKSKIKTEEAPETGIILDKCRLAILPFANISPDPNDEYFADGLTEEMISTLSRISELSVISRTSMVQYKNKSKATKDIGRELLAGTILEGSVRRAGNRIRISIQMIDSNQDKNLWAENFDRVLEDIFAIQSDIAQQVAGVLKVKLFPSEKKDVEKILTKSTQAHTLFLKGRYYFNERSRDSTDKAVKHFEEAIELDPGFGLAYAALADCYLIYSDYGWLDSKEAFRRVKEYSRKAIEIDPRLAEAHAALGLAHATYEYLWFEAENELKLAIELNPSYATAYHWYSLVLRAMGRLNESYEKIKRAFDLDPLSRVIGLNVGEVLLTIGKSEEAIEQLKKVIEANPDYAYAHMWLGWAHYLKSETDKGIEEARKSVMLSNGDPFYKTHLGCLLGFTGKADKAIEIVNELEDLSKTIYVDEGQIAYALFGAGKTDEAFNRLEKAYEHRSHIIEYLNWWPWLEQIRKDPRWLSIQTRIGWAKAK